MFSNSVLMVCTIILFSIAFAYILGKYNLHRFGTFAAIMGSSIFISLAYPFIMGAFYNNSRQIFKVENVWVLLSIIAFYISIVFALSMAFSQVINSRRGQEDLYSMLSISGMKYSVNTLSSKMAQIYDYKISLDISGDCEEQRDDREILNLESKDEDGLHDTEKSIGDSEKHESEMVGGNVDRNTNIGKIIIVESNTFQQDINDFINEAFRLKEIGDYEGAIMNFMHVLDKKPEIELVFRAVIEICVLYRSLGQNDFARSILESYMSSYEDVMNSTVKLEMQKLLL